MAGPGGGRSRPARTCCLAALQHDIGMAAWDAAPELDPRHRPPLLLHLDAAGDARRAVEPGRAAAGRPERLRGAAGVAARHRPLRALRLASRSGRPSRRAATSRPSAHSRSGCANRWAPIRPRSRTHAALLRCWDWLSLFLCTGAVRAARRWRPCRADGDTGRAACALDRRRRRTRRALAPWPFRELRLTLPVEGTAARTARYADRRVDAGARGGAPPRRSRCVLSAGSAAAPASTPRPRCRSPADAPSSPSAPARGRR